MWATSNLRESGAGGLLEQRQNRTFPDGRPQRVGGHASLRLLATGLGAVGGHTFFATRAGYDRGCNVDELSAGAHPEGTRFASAWLAAGVFGSELDRRFVPPGIHVAGHGPGYAGRVVSAEARARFTRFGGGDRDGTFSGGAGAGPPHTEGAGLRD